MRTLWISTIAHTGAIDIDERGIITVAPPVWKWSLYKHQGVLKRWLQQKFGKIDVEDITKEM